MYYHVTQGRLPAGLSRSKAVLYGTVTVAALDIFDAIVFFGITKGVGPIRILQGIAGGLIGSSAARSGGLLTALLGLIIHVSVAFAIVRTYVFISQRYERLLEHPRVYGPAYGVCVYLVMNFIVIPLSASGRGALTASVVINGLFIHLVGVGLPTGIFASKIRPPKVSRPSGSTAARDRVQPTRGAASPT